MDYETIWTFATRNFRVSVGVAPETSDPTDQLESGEAERIASSCAIEDWFQVRVGVFYDGELVGADYLGSCSYRSFEDFLAGHRDADPMERNCEAMRAAHGPKTVICHYFPAMVREAAAAARHHLARKQRKIAGLHLRNAA